MERKTSQDEDLKLEKEGDSSKEFIEPDDKAAAAGTLQIFIPSFTFSFFLCLYISRNF